MNVLTCSVFFLIFRASSRLTKHLSKRLVRLVKTVAVSCAGFHDREGQQYCQQCFLTLFASRCQGCTQPILENYISALSSLWHPQCFVCRVSASSVASECVVCVHVCLTLLFGSPPPSALLHESNRSTKGQKGQDTGTLILR